MIISQTRARQLRKRVNELETVLHKQRSGWIQEWPDGRWLLSMNKGEIINDEDMAVVRTARRLGHPVLVTEKNGALHFYGEKQP